MVERCEPSMSPAIPVEAAAQAPIRRGIQNARTKYSTSQYRGSEYKYMLCLSTPTRQRWTHEIGQQALMITPSGRYRTLVACSQHGRFWDRKLLPTLKG